MREKVFRPLIPAMVVAAVVFLAKTGFETNATLELLGIAPTALPWEEVASLSFRALVRPVNLLVFLNLVALGYFPIWFLLKTGLFSSKTYRSPKARKALHEP